MALSTRKELPFAHTWTLPGIQNGTLTCLAISPAGTRMIVASKDRNMLVIDFSDGSLRGIVSFEDQFYVMSATWYSENNLIIGGSNGSLYYVCFDPALVSARYVFYLMKPKLTNIFYNYRKAIPSRCLRFWVRTCLSRSGALPWTCQRIYWLLDMGTRSR